MHEVTPYFRAKVIGKAHEDFPTHILLPFFELLPSQTEFVEDSFPYFSPEQNSPNFDTANGSDIWVAFL